MKVVVTGADGFLGWHTRVRLAALTDHEVVPVGRSAWSDLPRLVKDADLVVHCAGVNRASDAQVRDGNRQMAVDVAAAVRGAGSRLRVAFANSVQADLDNVYGRAKRDAAMILGDAVADIGGTFRDVLLPNLFGEHGRPRYNSFVATFADAAVTRTVPDIVDREVGLLYVQDAAQALVDDGADGQVRPSTTMTSVGRVWQTLAEMHALYAQSGEMPDLSTPFDLALFNTLRAAMFPASYPIPITSHADARGRLIETVRTHGQGQSFLSTTRPGVTRGQHFHLEKVERFVVAAGEARIRLRRMFHDEVISFDVSGDVPVIVDMPTMWVHDITNVGHSELVTVFWSSSLFDPSAPDTFPQLIETGS